MISSDDFLSASSSPATPSANRGLQPYGRREFDLLVKRSFREDSASIVKRGIEGDGLEL
jgi:hypothetical protein